MIHIFIEYCPAKIDLQIRDLSIIFLSLNKVSMTKFLNVLTTKGSGTSVSL